MVARMSLSNIIKSLGHTVVGEASNGMEAIEKYSSLKPDIVTMDLTMDGCDGVQATTAILDEFPNARIVVISARQENRIIIDALEHGARHFIIKPVSSDKIRFVLKNVLQQNFDRHFFLYSLHLCQ
jgi:two-component system chemotaxis response regulator CheY